jgi:phosphoglycerol transferase MdoB-like AlkP superfamily enzyme
MKCRVKYLASFYLATVLVFIVAKVVFMAVCSDGHDVRLSDVPAVIGHGLTLDLSTALYLLIIPFLLCAVTVWLRLPQWLFRAYHVVVAVLLALAFVADTSLYPFWGFKLDASCLQYLDSPTEAMASVSTGYVVLRLVLFVAVTAAVYLQLHCSCTIPVSRHSRNDGKQRLFETLFYVVSIPLMVIGIRGGLDESTTNIGQVYYSQNQFLNHAAVNPVFNFFDSATHQSGLDDRYAFFDDEARCRELLAGVYTTESTGTDTLLTTTRPNIIIILLESAGEQFAGVMPRLQQLKREGVSFSRCYANSWRTDRGTVCVLSGYPSFPTLSVMKMPEKSRTLPGIARTLRAQGYRTSYLYGGDINFTNMRSYLVSTGWESLTWKADYSREQQRSAQWGVRDDITFETLYQMMTTLQPPFLIGYSTLSSHEPWDVPTKQLPDEVDNAFSYLDSCLYRFISRLRQTPQWANTLIVLTADHGINDKDIDQSRPLEKNHVPMLWIGGAVKGPRTVSTLCNQSDLAATLLAQLRLSHDDFTFSRDVLSHSYTHPVAVNNYSNAQWIVDSTGHVGYDFDGQRVTVDDCRDSQQLLRVSKAILQVTSNDLQNR